MKTVEPTKEQLDKWYAESNARLFKFTRQNICQVLSDRVVQYFNSKLSGKMSPMEQVARDFSMQSYYEEDFQKTVYIWKSPDGEDIKILYEGNKTYKLLDDWLKEKKDEMDGAPF